MSTEAPPASAPTWFEVSFDEERGLFRLSFDQDTYVRFFSEREIIALMFELRRAPELRRALGLGIGPGHD